MTTQHPKLLVMAGGTGGHIFPGLALANQLKKNGWNIHWMGSVNGMEENIVSNQNIPISLIAVSGVRGSGIINKLIAPMKIFQAILEALRIFSKVQPDVVVGMGGFVSGPGGVAARLKKIPLLIHEQNAISGYTNRILGKWAVKIACAFPNTFDARYASKINITGNPVREDICQLEPPQKRLRRQTETMKILIVGGSRGAKILNDIVPEALGHLQTSVQVHHQCGRGNQIEVENGYSYAIENGNKIQVFEFIEDMAQEFNWADLVICRAGALTISELMCVGIGSVLIPYPYAVDDHQTANGRFLEGKKAAILMNQKIFTSENLAKILKEIDREQIYQMGCNAFELNARYASENLASLCEQIYREKAA